MQKLSCTGFLGRVKHKRMYGFFNVYLEQPLYILCHSSGTYP